MIFNLEALKQQNPVLGKEIANLSNKLDEQFMGEFYKLMQQDVTNGIEDIGEKTYSSMLLHSQISSASKGGKGHFSQSIEDFLWRTQMRLQGA